MVLLQRKTSSIGKGLGKTSGWVHRAVLKAKGVEQVSGVVSYDRIDDEGLHVTVAVARPRTPRKGAEPVLEQRTTPSTASWCAPARSRCAPWPTPCRSAG